ncbi:probable F-box protein At4g22165 [Lolium rigidum]|uniref:probable F-box protein At4g22165 n=1 Tax=Lolium rigidum TaxID=89674 RepID=UPI001F5E2F23|nr:probable F-box protein At4g22165 [Lolium rigidum]
MELCSVASIMSLGSLAIHWTYLCSLVFRVLPKLLGFTPSSLKKFCKDVHQPLTETMVGTSPELPQDILMGIFGTLEMPDLIRAGAVCLSWHSAFTSLRSLGQYKLSQTPCLLYTSESASDSSAYLYSFSEKRSYKLTLPEPPIRTRCLIGSSHGLLVTVDERSEMHLVNPITCEQIALPSVITIEHVKPIFDEYGVLHKYEFSWHTGMCGCNSSWIFALDKLRYKLQYKAFVFPDASTGSYIVVLIHNPLRRLSFARVGDDKWTWLPPHDLYCDCIYKDGLLYAVSKTGDLRTFDLSGPLITTRMIISTPRKYEHEYVYIVQAPWGDLLLIWRVFEDYDIEPDPGASVFWNTTGFRIYQVEAAESGLKEINCLRDHVLFLGHNQSLCLSAEEYPSLRANHAYFTDDNALWTLGFKNKQRDMGILNLDDNSKEEHVSPQLCANFPAPIWITPDLRNMNVASGAA